MGRFSEPLAVRFVELAQVRPGQRALDVGCGPGALTAQLVARLGTEAVSAVDPSAPFVAAARDRFPGVDVRSGAAEQLPYPDDGVRRGTRPARRALHGRPGGRAAGDGAGHPARRPGRGLRLGPRGRRRTARVVLAGRARPRPAGRRRVRAGRRPGRSPDRAVRGRRPDRGRGVVADDLGALRDVRRVVGAVHARCRTGRRLRDRAGRRRPGAAAQQVRHGAAVGAVRDRRIGLDGDRLHPVGDGQRASRSRT